MEETLWDVVQRWQKRYNIAQAVHLFSAGTLLDLAKMPRELGWDPALTMKLTCSPTYEKLHKECTSQLSHPAAEEFFPEANNSVEHIEDGEQRKVGNVEEAIEKERMQLRDDSSPIETADDSRKCIQSEIKDKGLSSTSAQPRKVNTRKDLKKGKQVVSFRKEDKRMIRFIQENPKRPDTKSHERYERYKHASTPETACQMGAALGDLHFDHKKGYLILL
jgi:hypothetical protein